MPKGVYTRAKETKKKMRNRALKQFENGMPEETRKKISESNTGRIVTEKTRKKIKESNLKTYSNLKLIKILSEMKKGKKNPMFGKTPSEESKRKAIETKKKNGTINQTTETKRKISKTLKGHEVTEETREKQRKAKIGKYEGENNPSWIGGISFEPYGTEFNNRLKESIRERDNHTCQECGKEQKELKRKLCSHHIDYNKKNNSPLNLISLCIECHMKTNSNRKHWEEHFKMKIFIKEFFNPENLLIFNENKQLIGIKRI